MDCETAVKIIAVLSCVKLFLLSTIPASLSLFLPPFLWKKKKKNEIAYEHTGLFGNSSVNAIKKFLLQRETVIYIYITVAVQWTLYAE